MAQGTLDSKQDRNQEYTVVGISGTLGATYGTAQPRPITVTDDGKLRVESSASLSVGTIERVNSIGTLEIGTVISTLALNSGTITTGTIGGKAASGAAAVQNPVLIAGTDSGGTVYAPLVNSAGALSVTGASAGTTVNIATGTIGTVGTVAGVAVVTSVSEVANVAKGTITRVEGGTIGLVTRVSTVGTLEVGTISAMPNIPGGTIGVVSNLSNGSVRVTVGTMGGAVASGAAASGNPNIMAGTDAGGTVYGMLVDTAGNPQVDIVNTPAVTLGTLPGVGVVTSVTNLAGGTIGILTNGTLSSSGTTTGVGVVTTVTSVTEVANLAKGTITKLEGGTLGILSQGSINVTTGTIGGKAASGAAAVANPVLIAGTDAGGTVYAPLVTSGGALTVTGASAGTFVNISTGTLTEASNLAKGTITRLEGGTLGLVTTVSNLSAGSVAVTAGTVGGKAASGAAAVQNPVLIAGTDAGGTVYAPLVNSAGALSVTGASAGTFVNISTGTVNVVSTVTGVGVVTELSNVAKGTITRLEGGTLGILSQGSINVTSGTVGGKAASGAAAVANPVLVAGTDAGGTVYSLLVDNTGALQITSSTGNIPGGTLNLLQAGTITKLEQGSIQVTAGTIASVGTVPGVGVVTSVTNLASGTLAILTNGTLSSSGTTTGVGVVSALTTGTIGGKAASGAAAVANPVLVAGTDAGGTVYAPLMTTTGHQLIDILAGTIQSSGTTTGVGVVTSITNLAAGTVTRLEQGSINVTAGTIASVGTVPGVGVVTSVTNLAGGTIGILTNGTLSSSGTTTGVGVVTSITNLAAGTITRLEGGTLGILSQGSINVTAGTFRNDGRPSRNILTYGTTFGGGGAGYGTLVGSAAVGVGTAMWVNDLSVMNPNGDITCTVGFGTVLNGSSVVWKGEVGTTSAVGIQKSFPLAVNAGMTNQDFVIHLSGAGTVDVAVSYFISA